MDNPNEEDLYPVNDDMMKQYTTPLDINGIKDEVKSAAELIFNFEKDDNDSFEFSKIEMYALYNHKLYKMPLIDENLMFNSSTDYDTVH